MGFGVTAGHETPISLPACPDAPDDIGGRASALLLGRRDGVPGEHQAPVEAPDLRLARVPEVLERVPVDHVNDGAHHGRRGLFDSVAVMKPTRLEVRIGTCLIK